jgi:hypothetical protein
MWGYALFWSEVMLSAIPSLSYRSIGAVHLLRGRALALACWQYWGTDGLISLEVPLTASMLQITSYTQRSSLSHLHLLNETLASLRTARLCQERIGGIAAHMQASVEFVDLVLHHFLDPEDLTQAADLVIDEPVLITQSGNSIRRRNSNTVLVLVISRENVGEILSGIIVPLTAATARSMYPPIVIINQILTAKTRVLAGDLSGSKTFFDFACGNLQRYFFAAHLFIARKARYSLLSQFHDILASLCHCLLFFDREYINERLIAFDWLSDIDTLMMNSTRCITEENEVPIDATCQVKIATLRHVSSSQFPDFFKSLATAPRLEETTPPTIPGLLSLARANLRLCELQRLDDAGMTTVFKLKESPITIVSNIPQFPVVMPLLCIWHQLQDTQF